MWGQLQEKFSQDLKLVLGFEASLGGVPGHQIAKPLIFTGQGLFALVLLNPTGSWSPAQQHQPGRQGLAEHAALVGFLQHRRLPHHRGPTGCGMGGLQLIGDLPAQGLR